MRKVLENTTLYTGESGARRKRQRLTTGERAVHKAFRGKVKTSAIPLPSWSDKKATEKKLPKWTKKKPTGI